MGLETQQQEKPYRYQRALIVAPSMEKRATLGYVLVERFQCSNHMGPPKTAGIFGQIGSLHMISFMESVV